ncbi:HAAS signaling domain-containing protein [Bacillus horti]|uniref:Uncharacterized protein n=1 Tax=Caldalkalibacillus horti TaxID=77523 RepID=A0ABT9VWR5_9BACI|nr:hypothetical protein [Bacillus horti]MDQ0165335.1 hypothetical protein [Bacillus horti]
MELIDRYIYAVTERLPEKQRDEIKKELKGLIDEMLEERLAGHQIDQVTQEDVENVLQELGNPKELAAKYRGYDRYLIGPMFYGSYLSTLKVVLLSISILVTVMFAIDTFFASVGALEQLVSYFASIFTVGAQAFFWVTVIFAWMEYRQGNERSSLDNKKVGEWSLTELPQIPSEQAKIKMSEPIFGIFFAVLFTAISLYAVEWFGIWRFEEGSRSVISFLNAEAFHTYLPLIWGVAALGILKACVQIIARKRSTRLLGFNIIVSVVIVVLTAIIFSDSSIYNADFVQQMVSAGILSPAGEGYSTLSAIWDGVAGWTVVLVVIFTLIDLATDAYYTYRAKVIA